MEYYNSTTYLPHPCCVSTFQPRSSCGREVYLSPHHPPTQKSCRPIEYTEMACHHASRQRLALQRTSKAQCLASPKILTPETLFEFILIRHDHANDTKLIGIYVSHSGGLEKWRLSSMGVHFSSLSRRSRSALVAPSIPSLSKNPMMILC